LAIADDVESGIDDILTPNWSITDGTKVPKTEDIVLRNGAVKLEATYVYADMADSTGLAQSYNSRIVAKTIRCYLHAATKILKDQGAEIRSFDGDRVMGIFIGDGKNTSAARAALGISWAVEKIIKPRLKEKWDNFTWVMGHGIGIDTGEALLVRGGVRGSNDIVSVGRAPNIAAKLSEIRGYKSIYATASAYGYMNTTVKKASDGSDMWADMGTTAYGSTSVQYYGTAYWWKP
jgi:class 3 adenylate cyclase